MATRERREVEASLARKGFQREERDHIYFKYRSLSGKKTKSWTKISRGSKSRLLGSRILSDMAKQCGLRTTDFLDLVDCSLNREEFEKIAKIE